LQVRALRCRSVWRSLLTGPAGFSTTFRGGSAGPQGHRAAKGRQPAPAGPGRFLAAGPAKGSSRDDTHLCPCGPIGGVTDAYKKRFVEFGGADVRSGR